MQTIAKTSHSCLDRTFVTKSPLSTYVSSLGFFSAGDADLSASAFRLPLPPSSTMAFFFFLTTRDVRSLTGSDGGLAEEDPALSSRSNACAANVGAEECVSFGVVLSSSTWQRSHGVRTGEGTRPFAVPLAPDPLSARPTP